MELVGHQGHCFKDVHLFLYPDAENSYGQQNFHSNLEKSPGQFALILDRVTLSLLLRTA